MPEVLVLDEAHNKMREDLIAKRIKYKTENYYDAEHTANLEEDIAQVKKSMRKRAEDEILKRVNAIRCYLQDPDREKYISHEKIFQTYLETGSGNGIDRHI